MADTYVLVMPHPSPHPASVRVQRLLEDLDLPPRTRSSVDGPVRLKEAHRGVPRGHGRRLWRQAGRTYEVRLEVTPSEDAWLSPDDRRLLHALIDTMGKGDHLVVAVTPPAVLVEHLWRRDVWRGGTETVEDLSGRAFATHRELWPQIWDLTERAPHSHVVSTTEASPMAAVTGQDACWRLSARGTEILRRMNGHAVDGRERKRMREFCVQAFPASAEPGSALDEGTVAGLLGIAQETSGFWPRDVVDAKSPRPRPDPTSGSR